MGDLWAGEREPEPARLHRDVPGWLPDPGHTELAGRVPAGGVSGHLHRSDADRHRAPARVYQEQLCLRPGAAPAARPAPAVEPAAPAAPRARSAAPGADPTVRAAVADA